jgi:hypothetical protein
MEQYAPYLEETGWFFMERQPVRVAGGGQVNKNVLRVQCHVEQYIRAKYPHITFNLISARAEKNERAASASTREERKKMVWKPENNVMGLEDLKVAYRKWLTGKVKKGVPEVKCDAVEAAQICAYGMRNRHKLVYHIANKERKFSTMSMSYVAVPLEEQITKS